MSCKKHEDKALKWSEMKFVGKVRYMLQKITVEPVIFLHVLSSVFSKLATQCLNLEKACRVNLHYSDKVCSSLKARRTDSLSLEEEEVQRIVARMVIWQTILRSSFPSCLILFCGSWSDRHKRRKPFMLIPIFGEFITSLGLLMCVHFFYELPMEVAGFVEAFFPAVTGDWFTLLMAAFSYIGDITSVEMRSVRIGLLNMCSSIGIPLGTALSGIMLNIVGFHGVFTISATMYAAAFIYGLTFMNENSTSTSKTFEKSSDQDNNQFKAFQTKSRWSIIDFIRDFFDLQHVKDTLCVVFKDGANNRKKRVIMLIIAQMTMYGPHHGESTLIYLYMRYRFNWDEVRYSMFATYNVILHIIGNSAVVGFLIHCLKYDDATIGVIACVSRVSARFVYAFAATEKQVYIAPLVDVFSWSGSIAMRSIASKLVPPEELGQLFSVYGASEALVPLLYGPVFAHLYSRTLHTFPGAFLFLCGILYLPALAIFLWLYREHRADKMRSQPT